MKKMWLLLLVCVWLGCDKFIEPVPDDPNAPKTVVLAIAERFDAVTELTLTSLKKDALYAADFWSQAVHYKAIISLDGTFKNLDREVPTGSMPTMAQRYIDAHFPGYEVDDLYQNIDPVSRVAAGYFARVSSVPDRYLLAFDTLGVHISSISAPASDWWLRVQQMTELPANIRSFLQTEHPSSLFHHATLFIDAFREDTWRVGVRNANFLDVYTLDTSANVLQHHTEDLFEIEGQNLTVFDFPSPTQLPTVISDFLDAQFPGWQYERGAMLLDSSNSLASFLVIIDFNQTTYYTRFDMTGGFTGANKE